MYTIARNAGVSAFRRNRQRTRWEHLAPDERPIEAQAADGGHEPSLECVLAQIPDTQREALEMVELEGLSIEDAAARAGVSEGALRVRIHRGYRALRALLLGEDS